MLFRDVIDLVSVTTVENDMGDSIEARTERQVFANEKGIRQSEFYQAMATGLKPEIMLEIKKIDYQNEERLVFNGKEYNIIRSYSTKNECLEIVCSGWVV